MSGVKFVRAEEIEWQGKKATEMTHEELLDFVEQLNWLIAQAAQQLMDRPVRVIEEVRP